MNEKTRVVWVQYLLFSVIAVYLLFLLFIPPDPLSLSDAKSYYFTAGKLIEEGIFLERFDTGTEPTSWRPPLTALILGAFRFAGLCPNQIIFFYWLMASLTAILLALSARKLLHNENLAYLAGFLYMAFPETFFSSRILMSETPFMLLIALTIYLLTIIRYKSDNSKLQSILLAATGLIFGLSLLTRTVGLAFLPGIFWILWFVDQRKDWLAFLKRSSIFLFGIAIVLTPWIIRNYKVNGEFVFINTAGAYNVYIGNVYDTSYLKPEQKETLAQLRNDFSESEVANRLKKATIDFIRHNPGVFAKQAIRKAIRYFWPYMHSRNAFAKAFIIYSRLFHMAFLLSLALTFYFRNWRLLPFATMPILLMILHSLTFTEARFILPAVLPLMILVVGSIDRILGKNGSKKSQCSTLSNQ